MQLIRKIKNRSVWSMSITILFTSVILGLGFNFSASYGNPLIMLPLAGTIAIAIAFGVSVLLTRLFGGPLLRAFQNKEERSIIRTRNQFAYFMEELPLGVFIKDSQSRAVYLNRYMDNVFGKSNCLGKTPYNIFDRETAHRVMDEDTRVIAGEDVMVEEVLTDKHGRERVYMTHKFCMQDDGSEPMVGGISIEITRRREAEYKLRILSRAIRNSPVCVIITDPSGNIEFVNPAFVNTTGYSFAEVMGENMRMLNSGHHDPSFFREMWSQIKKGTDWQGEILNKKKDGSLYWELVTISAVTNRKGEITHFVAIKDDISKRKQMEEALVSAKLKAEESDKLKSAFLANMSHEIRTPMNAIVGLSGLLGDTSLPLNDRKSFSEIIKENSNVLLQLIDDIVDISKIEAGQVVIRPVSCNITALLKEVHDSFRLQVKNRDVELVLARHDCEKELHTITDPQRLRQIITNLIGNALKFTSKGRVEFGCVLQNDGKILFSVSDTGIGIPEEKMDLIFDRFRQVDDTGVNNHRGAGLGLSISRSLAELLGGTIRAESEVGKGSQFYFTIPYQPVIGPQESDTSEKETVSYPKLNGEKILVIEDLEVNFRLIEAMLKKTGARILWAKSGREALDIFDRTRNLSLVLLDLNMPDMHGYDILLKFKKERPELPVIVQTAYAMNGERERCARAGCDSYITKPIRIEQLLGAMHVCLLQEN
jgi:PAS domain S-box-containing protein